MTLQVAGLHNDGGMDSRFRGNDPGKARLYGAGIKGSGSDESDPYGLLLFNCFD